MRDDLAIKLFEAAEQALEQMCRANAPDNKFTDAVDALDDVLILARIDLGRKQPRI